MKRAMWLLSICISIIGMVVTGYQFLHASTVNGVTGWFLLFMVWVGVTGTIATWIVNDDESDMEHTV